MKNDVGGVFSPILPKKKKKVSKSRAQYFEEQRLKGKI